LAKKEKTKSWRRMRKQRKTQGIEGGKRKRNEEMTIKKV